MKPKAIKKYICVVFAASFAVIGLMQGVAILVWPTCTPSMVHCHYDEPQEKLFYDIVQQIVPGVRVYTNDGRADFSRIGSKVFVKDDDDRDCVSPWIDGLMANLTASGTELSTDPLRIQSILRRMGLDNLTAVRQELGTLLTEPLDFSSMLEETRQCAKANAPLHQALCGWIDDPTMVPVFVGEPAHLAEVLIEAVNLGMVMDKIARAYGPSSYLRSAVGSYYGFNSRRILQQIDDLKGVAGEKTTSWRRDKWRSVSGIEIEAKLLQLMGGDTDVAKLLQNQLSMNVLEAVNYDISEGTTENVALGLALASSTVTAMPMAPQGDPKLVYKLGKVRAW